MCTSRLARAFRHKMARPQAVKANLLLLNKCIARLALRESLHMLLNCKIRHNWDGNQYAINRRTRLDTHLIETHIRCSRSIGKSASIDYQKIIHFFIRCVFFRFFKAFLPFASRFRTKFQRYNKDNYLMPMFNGRFANAARAPVTTSRNLFSSTGFDIVLGFHGQKTNERLEMRLY